MKKYMFIIGLMVALWQTVSAQDFAIDVRDEEGGQSFYVIVAKEAALQKPGSKTNLICPIGIKTGKGIPYASNITLNLHSAAVDYGVDVLGQDRIPLTKQKSGWYATEVVPLSAGYYFNIIFAHGKIGKYGREYMSWLCLENAFSHLHVQIMHNGEIISPDDLLSDSSGVYYATYKDSDGNRAGLLVHRCALEANEKEEGQTKEE